MRLLFLLMAVLAAGCSPGDNRLPREGLSSDAPADAPAGTAMVPAQESAASPAVGLEELAEAERGGSYFAGMGLLESMLREQNGDYSGALLAAFKEMEWLYATGEAAAGSVEAGLNRVIEQQAEFSAAAEAARAALAFIHGAYADAAEKLRAMPGVLEEPDGMGNWMLLVCDMESGGADAAKKAAYAAIRARFTAYPDYWRRGMRFFGGEVGARYAEHCINAAPEGPYAAECREFLAAAAGLEKGDGPALRTTAEMESLISRARDRDDPRPLEELFPLLTLRDNRYTFAALELLRPLSRFPRFGRWFRDESAKSADRLADRLKYLGG